MIDYHLEDVPIASIICCPQVRKEVDEEELAGLAQSIREQGLQQPVILYRSGDELVLLEGWRRLLALKKNGETVVRALISDRPLTTAEVIELQLTVNCQRASLTPIEKANAIAELLAATGLGANRIAEKLGMSAPAVSRLLTLRLLSPEMQQRVAAGEIGVSTAYEIAKVSDPAERSRLIQQATKSRVTRRQVTHPTAARSSKPRAKRAERVVLPLGEGRTVAVMGQGLSVAMLKQWLDQLIAKLRNVGDDMSLGECRKRLAK